MQRIQNYLLVLIGDFQKAIEFIKKETQQKKLTLLLLDLAFLL